MGQPKGKTGNPHGRPKGSPNKATQELREWIAKLIDDNRDQIRKDLKMLEPKERLLVLEKFIQYTLPKPISIDTKHKDTEIDCIIMAPEDTKL